MAVMDQLISLIRRSVDAKQVTMTELASLAGCSRQHLYQILSGDQQPTLPLAEKLLAALGAEIVVKTNRPAPKRKKIAG